MNTTLRVLLATLIIVLFFYSTATFREEQYKEVQATDQFMAEGGRFTQEEGDVLIEKDKVHDKRITEIEDRLTKLEEKVR